jgi:hypothetical protein
MNDAVIWERIQSLKNELLESSSEQYKEEIRRQIARLEKKMSI